ncbi:uncharacterized protein LOC118561136 [Fundulus heteroclitus]|uniref:uncharacterized protein LOC118561136 n=1 Tax=Fundulus heteroclitus TaxID=8078 RepID=UPI00165C5E69|nr:uncharacterized protein LOC118561136 [Fundulus heteroclitus]
MDNPNGSETLLRRQILERLLSKMQHVLSHPDTNVDYLHFMCTHELVLVEAVAEHVAIPVSILSAIRQLCSLLRLQVETEEPLCCEVEVVHGAKGRPKFCIQKEKLQDLMETQLPIPCIAQLLGVSERTIFRRLMEFGISVRGSYSSMPDEELDNVVRSIKAQMPHLGYRLVMGRLRSLGHRIQWSRVKASMHRVDGTGALSRLTQLGCVVRRSYSVRAPLSLVHVDTNHKLIRFNIVIFGGIDGFSRKVMYLEAANNNKASTAFKFFLSSCEKNGLPSRVRGDQGVENLDIAQFMFTVQGTDRGSFISGKSVHNQRIERLWRDVWMAVTKNYYEILHSLEEDGLLDISNTLHIFLLHFVFLPRLHRDLQTFTEGWNNHPLRTEGNMTPHQLWDLGLLHSRTNEDVNEHPDLNIDWESALHHVETDEQTGLVVPEFPSPLNDHEMRELQAIVDPTAPSESYGRDIFCRCIQIFQ